MVAPRILIAGGGTGGHVFPMVAVANALRAEREDTELLFVGTGRGIETRVVPDAGYDLKRLNVLPLRGRGLGGFVRGAARAIAIVPEARRLVRQFAPDVVFSVGGYAAGPVSVAARSCGVPVTLMEPNAVAGFTNRLLRPFICRAYVCFPEAGASFAKRAVRHTGVPLRREFSPAPYSTAKEPMRVLIMGGSQGAAALNEAMPRAVGRAIEAGVKMEVVHQTGRGKDEAVVALYAELGLRDAVHITTFIDDVAEALSEADLVIERSGAGSLAELCSVGRPGLLIPYPHAADDHQRHNAESLVRDGAAVCVLQAEATEERLAEELQRLGPQYGIRREMAEAATRRGRPHAAAEIARDLLALALDGQTASNGLKAGSRSGSAGDDGVVRRCLPTMEVRS